IADEHDVLRGGKQVEQLVFNRLGGDVVAGVEDDQVLDATGNLPVPCRADFSLIAGMEPAVAQNFGSFFGTIPVPGKHVGSVHKNLVVLTQLHFDSRHGAADAARFEAARVVHGADGCGLGEAVHLQDGNAQHHEVKL